MKGALAWSGVFALVLVATGVTLVHVQHQRRALFVELQELQLERDEMLVEWGRLQLEQSTLANHDRVERLARSKLDLEVPAAAGIVLVSPR